MDAFMKTRTDHLRPTWKSCEVHVFAAIETEQGHRWAESMVKRLTGCDKILVRSMRKLYFKLFFKLFSRFKQIIVSVYKPAVGNNCFSKPCGSGIISFKNELALAFLGLIFKLDSCQSLLTELADRKTAWR
jgi:hypothetical protein